MDAVGKSFVIKMNLTVGFNNRAVFSLINAVDIHFYFGFVNSTCILSVIVLESCGKSIRRLIKDSLSVFNFCVKRIHGENFRVYGIVNICTVDKLNVIKINLGSSSVTVSLTGLERNPEHTAALIEAERSICAARSCCKLGIHKVKLNIFPACPVDACVNLFTRIRINHSCDGHIAQIAVFI